MAARVCLQYFRISIQRTAGNGSPYEVWRCIRRQREDKRQVVDVVTKTDDINSFAILRQSIILTVENLRMNAIANIGKSRADRLKSLASVVIDKPLDVFAENNFRSVVCTNANDFAKECSAKGAVIIIVETCAAFGQFSVLGLSFTSAESEQPPNKIVILSNINAKNFFDI